MQGTTLSACWMEVSLVSKLGSTRFISSLDLRVLCRAVRKRETISTDQLHTQRHARLNGHTYLRIRSLSSQDVTCWIMFFP